MPAIIGRGIRSRATRALPGGFARRPCGQRGPRLRRTHIDSDSLLPSRLWPSAGWRAPNYAAKPRRVDSHCPSRRLPATRAKVLDRPAESGVRDIPTRRKTRVQPAKNNCKCHIFEKLSKRDYALHKSWLKMGVSYDGKKSCLDFR